MRNFLIFLAFNSIFISCDEKSNRKINNYKSKGKIDCGCPENKILNREYKCDTLILSNNSFLFWKVSCDTISYNFQNKHGKIVRLKTCFGKESINCSRSGLSFLEEYPNYLLFKYDWVSGCCQPPDILFLDKFTGEKVNKINMSEFIYGETELDYTLYFDNGNHEELILLFNQTDKKYSLSLPKNRINKTLKTYKTYPSDLFKNFNLNSESFTFEYEYLSGKVVLTEKIRIDL